MWCGITAGEKPERMDSRESRDEGVPGVRSAAAAGVSPTGALPAPAPGGSMRSKNLKVSCKITSVTWPPAGGGGGGRVARAAAACVVGEAAAGEEAPPLWSLL